jgi:signal transduction histidine kinase
MLALFPLLFFFHRDEHNTEADHLDDMIHSVDFKVMVYVSLAAAFPLTADLIIDFCTTKEFCNMKQVIPRVSICGTLLSTALLHLYFTLYLGSVYASWVIMNMRLVMSASVLLHQCQIRCGHVMTPAYSYFTLFCWNFGTIVKCYGGNLAVTLLVGKYMRYASIFLTLVVLIDHVRQFLKGDLDAWYSRWHQICFEVLLLFVVGIGVLTTVAWPRNQIYDVSPMRYMVLSYDAIIFLVMMSIIITNEFRHEHAQAQVQLEVKRMFVKYVSHEVRTPLNSCMLGLQYMKEAILRPTEECVQEIAGILDEVSEGCSTAIDFMNNLLLYEKIDSMDLPLYMKREDLSNVCAEVLQSFKMSARQLGVNLKLHIHESLKPPSSEIGDNSDFFTVTAAPQRLGLLQASVEIDGPKVVVVMRNLLSNALKFTPEHGEVSLSVIPVCLPSSDRLNALHYNGQDPRKVSSITPICPTSDTTHFRVILSDTGRGMSVEEQRQLFTKMVQFSPNENQKGGGSGIGLFLSHQIMKDHNLKIHVFSEGFVGSGTHFFVDFPRLFSEDETVVARTKALNVTSRKVPDDDEDSSGNSFLKSPRTLINYLQRSVVGVDVTKKSFLDTDDEESAVDDDIDDCDEEETWMKQNVTRNMAGKGSAMVDPFNRKHSSAMLSKIIVPKNQSSVMTNKSLNNLSVLVVDDSALNRKMLIRTLKQHHVGKSFDGVSDGLKLLCHLGLSKSDSEYVPTIEVNGPHLSADLSDMYDVILLDDHMTDMNGSVAIQILRRSGYEGLVVGLTGSAMDDDLSKFCAAGVDYALPKPFVFDDFLHILQSHFNK